MLRYYALVKLVHVGCVGLSGGVFFARGVLMLAGSALAGHPRVKRLSYAIDSTLLAAAVVLVISSRQYPFVQGWLTAKVLLLPVYVLLGIFALRRGKSRAARAGFFAAALAVYVCIIGVAVTHDPRGWLRVFAYRRGIEIRQDYDPGESRSGLMTAAGNAARGASMVSLPPPADDASLSVFAALAERRTTREISAKPLSRQLLANLLWAACGVNREVGPFGLAGRTAASASNSQEVDVYVALKDGAYRYDALEHALSLIVDEDVRQDALTPGQQAATVLAPVQLIYVADVHRLTHTAGFQEPRLHDPEGQKAYYYVDTGLIAGNVYLFAASQGLAAWFHNCDRGDLARRLQLGPEQHALFAQSVGYPEMPTE